MIIDCHCHAGKGDGLTGPWDTDASLDNYLRWATEFGINRTVLFAAFNSNFAKANYEVAKIVNANPSRFYGFAFVNAAKDTGNIYAMVRIAVQQYHFCGIKVHRYYSNITREVCETARAFKLPILYDVMGETSHIDLFARQYPDVNFIIPHLSSFADDWKSQMAFISALERYANIHTDLSGVRRYDVITEAYKRVGPRKILFGSDGPWIHPGLELMKIYALHTDKESEDLMLYKNFLRLTRHHIRPSTITQDTYMNNQAAKQD